MLLWIKSCASINSNLWSSFQLFIVSKKSASILEIVLSTVGGSLFLVIMTFAVITRRLYVKNLSYRKLEQGEPSPSYLTSSMIILCMDECWIHLYTHSMRAKFYITTLVLVLTFCWVWLFLSPIKVWVFLKIGIQMNVNDED